MHTFDITEAEITYAVRRFDVSLVWDDSHLLKPLREGVRAMNNTSSIPAIAHRRHSSVERSAEKTVRGSCVRAEFRPVRTSHEFSGYPATPQCR